jgi:hypothetical protein
MAKISVIMEFDFDGFDDLDYNEKIEAIETVLDSGAESTNSFINVQSVGFLK